MRFLALDGWRGIAAILVALYHLGFYNHIYDFSFLRNSYLFVDFFFVLSGFVISYAYQNRLTNTQQTKEFIILRIARLWPLHVFILALFILLELIKLLVMQKTGGWSVDTAPFTHEYSIESIVSNIFLLQSINLHDQLTWNYPSWSISVEFYTYLVFMVFTQLTQRYKQLTKPIHFIIILASFLMLYFNVDNLDEATYQNGIFRCILGFFLGNICFEVFMLNKDKKIPFPSIIEISVLISIILFVCQYGSDKYSLFAPFLFVIVVFIFAYEQGIVSQFLKISIIQNIGKWSYSIYMIHAFLILVIGRLFSIFERTTGNDLTIQHTYNNLDETLIYFKNMYVMDFLTLGYITILIVLASFSFKYIELKGSSLIKKSIFTEKEKIIPT